MSSPSNPRVNFRNSISANKFPNQVYRSQTNMVSCPKSPSLVSCDDEFSSEEEESMKCGKNKKSCDCSQIVGRDHLKTKRARKFKCNSKRIQRLAEPKHVTPKCCQHKEIPQGPHIEVVKPDEQTPVRIKMLAYPKVEKLVATRDEYKKTLDKQWYDRLESYIKVSMKSMYSRLANCQLAEHSQKKKWTREDWKRHCEWMKKRAVPKKPIKGPPKAKRQIVPLDDLLPGLEKLAKPRNPAQKYRFRCGYVSTVKETALLYNPTERVLKLALPKKSQIEDEEDEDITPFAVKPSALEYKPSKCLKSFSCLKFLHFFCN